MSGIVVFLFDTLVLVVAGLVRGFSGFGFAMVAVTGLSLVHSPARVVPAILCLEILASMHLLPSIWSHVRWGSIFWLVAGMVLGTAPGVWLLAHASPALLRAWVSVAVLAGATALTRERALPGMEGRGVQLVAGACSGLLNASASIGGPPVILYYLATAQSPEHVRASLIAFFVIADAFALAAMAAMGLLGQEVAMAALWWLLPALGGVSLGRLLFERHGAQHYRRAVVALLLVLAALGVGRSVWDWYRPATERSSASTDDQTPMMAASLSR
ncbi:MAG: hypothetical protein KatS3mg077_2111 [Candidatus Binatia bacterium]|nr:MAG: hypothetical protein KatS3mg077_2111 [Candidatus Binatia bacterium]